MSSEEGLDIDRVLTIGLYNTYDKNISPVHIRAVARAAPLCWAYGLHLALVNFPFADEQDAVDSVMKDTSIGKGGAYLKHLHDAGKLHVVDDPSDLGVLVATTSHPDVKKSLSIEDLREMESDLCFLLGVGRSGLPARLLDQARIHMEFTGRNIPLETCTAMGVLARMMRELYR